MVVVLFELCEFFASKCDSNLTSLRSIEIERKDINLQPYTHILYASATAEKKDEKRI